MSSAALTKFVARADAQRVRSAFQALSGQRINGRWISTTNRYKPGAARKTASGQPNPQLAAYLSVSASLHCVDGWSYLGRAIGSHFVGDHPAALHLAYYAELRAALSLLASQGVAVFNYDHAVIDGQGRGNARSGEGTHAFTWNALEAWSGMTASGDLFGRTLRVAAATLADWTARFAGGNVALAPLAGELVRIWGFDLKAFAKDRELRNMASYEPTELLEVPPATALESSRFVRGVWQLCLPIGPDSFGRLDMHLLRKTLRYVFGGLGLGGEPEYAQHVGRAVDAVAVSLSEGQRNALKAFLVDATDDEVIAAASATVAGPVPLPRDMQVIGRAVLLLRLATGAVSEFVTPAVAGTGQLDFWWKRWASERAIWSVADDPTSRVANLVGEVDDALNELATWEAAGGAVTSDRRQWLAAAPTAAWTLLGAERVALWSIGL